MPSREKTALLAGVLPLASAKDAEYLNAKYTDFSIPEAMISRIRSAGDAASQQKEGIKICIETIAEIKRIKGIRGIHILSGGREDILSEVRDNITIKAEG